MPVVIDASAGVEILANTAHGRRLARLLPTDAVGWVPEHFYVEVAGVVTTSDSRDSGADRGGR
jgi:hypothetical protein